MEVNYLPKNERQGLWPQWWCEFRHRHALGREPTRAPCHTCLPPPDYYCDGGRTLVCEVENYVEGRNGYFANKVYALVDKVFYPSGQYQRTKHVMPELCDAIETDIEESA